MLRFPRWRSLTAAVPFSLVVLAGRAAADVEPVRLTYSAYPGCPDEDRFLEEVATRTERVRRAAEGARARVFVVTVTQQASTIRGALSIQGLDGSVTGREVTGDSCEEVLSALALIMALAVDPRAATAQEAPKSVTGPSSPGDAGDLAPLATAPDAAPSAGSPMGLAASSSTGAVPPDPRRLDRAPEAASMPAPSGTSARPRWALGGEGQALAGLVPGLAIGGGGFVEVTGAAHGYLVPSFRVSLFATTTRADLAPPVGAQLDWFLGRIEACPLRFVWIPDLALSVCASLDAGVLRSTGIGLEKNGTSIRPWFAPAVLARLGWSWTDALFGEAGGGLTAPLNRYSFDFQQAGMAVPPFQQIPVLAVTLQVDAGVRFR